MWGTGDATRKVQRLEWARARDVMVAGRASGAGASGGCLSNDRRTLEKCGADRRVQKTERLAIGDSRLRLFEARVGLQTEDDGFGQAGLRIQNGCAVSALLVSSWPLGCLFVL